MSVQVNINVTINESGVHRVSISPMPSAPGPIVVTKKFSVVLPQGTSVLTPGLAAAIPSPISSS